MKDIPLPEDETVSLDDVAPGIVGLRVLFVNLFAVRHDDSWTLIDAGLYGFGGRIRNWARHHFGDDPPGRIVLTHAHFDHVGALTDLARHWQVPVYIHGDEVGYVRGEQAYPPPDPSVGGGLMARMSVLYPRTPTQFDGDLRELPSDGSIPGMAGWRWIHTPGHSAGHVSLVRASDHALIVGDAFCTTRQESFLAVAAQTPELHGPPAYFTTDWDAARESVRRLSALSPAYVAPGHGQPMSGPKTQHALAQLAADFDTLARPEHGRYVAHPTRG